jgi:hypothetical protein
MGLSQFLESKGFSMNPGRCEEHDGYMAPAQKDQFTQQLARYPHIEKIAEIGFNGGQSADHFFSLCKNLKIFVAFDLNCYPCTQHAVEYFYKTYEKRFVFVPGDSLVTVPELGQRFPDLKFDLIYIDGCHHFEWALGDIVNAKKMAHENTLLWIDDVEVDEQNPVALAVKFAETLGLIKIEESFHSSDPHSGKRQWIQAKIIL